MNHSIFAFQLIMECWHLRIHRNLESRYSRIVEYKDRIIP